MAEFGSDGHLYFFGGQGTRRYNTLHRWTAATDMTWEEVHTTGTEAPPPRCKGTLTRAGDNLYLFGGWGAGRKKLNDIWRIRVGEWRWDRLQPKGAPPPPRSSHAATLLPNGQILVFGGIGDNKYNDTWRYDIAKNSWHPVDTGSPAPGRRSSYGALHLHAGHLYLFGGLGCGQFNDIWRLRLPEALGGPPAAPRRSSSTAGSASGFLWEELKPCGGGTPPLKRGRHVTAVVGGVLHVLCGTNLRCCFADHHALDLASLAWSQLPMPKAFTPKEGCAFATSPDGTLYIHGGMASGNTWFTSMWAMVPPAAALSLAVPAPGGGGGGGGGGVGDGSAGATPRTPTFLMEDSPEASGVFQSEEGSADGEGEEEEAGCSGGGGGGAGGTGE